MTKEEINKAIAERVMGWHEHPYENDKPMQNINAFNPAERIDHAMMVLDKFGDWMLEKTTNGQYYCRIGWGFSEGAWATTKEEAVCLAALEAVPPGGVK